MRIGTWNLEQKWTKDHAGLIAKQKCGVWLLTEVFNYAVERRPLRPESNRVSFWYGDPNQRMNLTLMLLKRSNGDLKVWPITVWPKRHPYQRKLQLKDPNVSNRYNVRSVDDEDFDVG